MLDSHCLLYPSGDSSQYSSHISVQRKKFSYWTSSNDPCEFNDRDNLLQVLFFLLIRASFLALMKGYLCFSHVACIRRYISSYFILYEIQRYCDDNIELN